MSALDQFVASDSVKERWLISSLIRGMRTYNQTVLKDYSAARNYEMKRISRLVQSFADGRPLYDAQIQELSVICLFDPNPLLDLERLILEEFGVEVT